MNLRSNIFSFFLAVLVALAGAGCTTAPYRPREAADLERPQAGSVLRSLTLDPALEDRILALDPERITDNDVRTTLAAAPAPQIMLIHGGLYPVHLVMISFVKFLVAMGYPETRIRDPADGAYSYSPYRDAEQLAGLVAWYYERYAMRPMLIGHSQGGMQAIKVLHELDGAFDAQVHVWNPFLDQAEDRVSIIDPLTGVERPVIGLSVAYASGVGAGGSTLLMPNQWNMFGKLGKIPNTVDEFTGFSIGLDLVALTFPGAPSEFKHNGTAVVRNVVLPASYFHVAVPLTQHLAKDKKLRAWIDAYVPDQPGEASTVPDGSNENVLWAADVWYSIKKHWCLEAQRLIRAKRAALRQP